MCARILVVEDDDRFRYGMCQELEAAGYDVTQAHDYRGALEVLESDKKLAVLLVELALPMVNGFALARMARLRQPNLKTIYITDRKNIPANEAWGPVLHKPIEADLLLRTIGDSLRSV